MKNAIIKNLTKFGRSKGIILPKFILNIWGSKKVYVIYEDNEIRIRPCYDEDTKAV